MAPALKRYALPMGVAVLILVAGGAAMLGWQRFNRDYVVSVEDDGSAVTKLIDARLDGMSSLKVATLSGTIQSTAQDVRGFGLLKSDQVVKMPFSVDYFIDSRTIGAHSMEWNAASRTLIVNAPDVMPARPNVDESQRTLVQTNGLFVTRKAGEALSQQISAHAQGRAETVARSPERMAQARELGRAALSKLFSAPLAQIGFADARVIVTFPPERHGDDRERWDESTALNQALSAGKR